MQEAPAAPLRWQDLPGPRGWPVVGNALQIDRNTLHLQLEEWARRYGRAFAFRIGRRPFVGLSDPDAIGKVLRDRPEGFRRSTRAERISAELGFSGLFTANGDRWRRQRPMVLASFDPGHIRNFFPTLERVTQRLSGRWRRAAQAAEAIDLQADLMRYTVDVTAALAFGEDVNTIEAEGNSIQQHLNVVLPAMLRRGFSLIDTWKYFPTRKDRELVEHVAAIQSQVRIFIAKARQRLQDEPALREHPENLMQAMVAARDRDAGLTDDDVSGNVLTMLLAGEDTTANTIAWMTWLLARNPQALQRAAQEAREVLQGRACADGLEQLSHMDWIEACANEAMRLKPVAPISFQEAVRPSVVGGIQVERGMVIACLLRAGGVDAANFPQPADFRPERWLTGEAGAAHALTSNKRAVMPFGAGPRMCPGRYLALAEIKMAASMLLANFELESVEAAGGGEPKERFAVTMAPDGLLMRLRA